MPTMCLTNAQEKTYTTWCKICLLFIFPMWIEAMEIHEATRFINQHNILLHILCASTKKNEGKIMR